MEVAPETFEYLSKLVRDEAAIVLEPGKEYLISTRLAPVLKKHGWKRFEEMVAAVKVGDRAARAITGEIVDALTTNETSFFRDVKPFDLLKDQLLPELLKERSTARRLRMLCAACSTGQEPYSIAMLLRENFPELRTWDVEIIAADLSPSVLEKARSGEYTQIEINRGLPALLLTKYFERKGMRWIVKDDLKALITFQEINLCRPWPPFGTFDLIFIRNVLIYFDAETKREIFKRVRAALNPGGYMFLGAAETTINLDSHFERVQVQGTGCYRLMT